MPITYRPRSRNEQQRQKRKRKVTKNDCGTLVKQIFSIGMILSLPHSTFNSVMAFTTTIRNQKTYTQSMMPSFVVPTLCKQYEHQHKLFSTKEKTVHGNNTIPTRRTTSDKDEYNTAIQKFITVTTSSLSNNENNSFISFSISGPPKPSFKKNKNAEQVEKEKEQLRGCIRLITGRLVQLKKNKKKKNNDKEEMDIVLQVTLKYHGATDVAKNWKIENTKKEMEDNLSKLFFQNSQKEEKDDDDNDSFQSEWGNVGTNKNGIRSATLETTHGSWNLILQPPSQNSKKKKKGKYPSCTFTPNKNPTSKQSNDNNIASHDRVKNVPISTSSNSNSLYLQKLGLLDVNTGKPRKNKSSKLRQCFKFVEIVSKLIEPYVAPSSDQEEEEKKGKMEINTMDMGCGRGYLTFSLHSYLMEKYGTVEKDGKEKVEVNTKGVDVRPKLVREMNDIVQDLSNDCSTFDSLEFVEGTIESILTDYKNNNNDHDENKKGIKEKKSKAIDILIALHACDTATDDALYYGIQSSSSIIVVAPCCHKEIRRQLSFSSNTHPYGSLLRHNIYSERLAEMITDSIRALVLELYGYNVNVFEFVGGEHTAKNVMIVATKRSKKRSVREEREVRRKLVRLAELHGITKQRLATMWMGESLVDGNGGLEKEGEEDIGTQGQEDMESNSPTAATEGGRRRKAVTLKAGSMPPLEL